MPAMECKGAAVVLALCALAACSNALVISTPSQLVAVIQDPNAVNVTVNETNVDLSVPAGGVAITSAPELEILPADYLPMTNAVARPVLDLTALDPTKDGMIYIAENTTLQFDGYLVKHYVDFLSTFLPVASNSTLNMIGNIAMAPTATLLLSNAAISYDCPFVGALPWVVGELQQATALAGTTQAPDYYLANAANQISVNFHQTPILSTHRSGGVGVALLTVVNSTIACSYSVTGNNLTDPSASTRDIGLTAVTQANSAPVTVTNGTGFGAALADFTASSVYTDASDNPLNVSVGSGANTTAILMARQLTVSPSQPAPIAQSSARPNFYLTAATQNTDGLIFLASQANLQFDGYIVRGFVEWLAGFLPTVNTTTWASIGKGTAVVGNIQLAPYAAITLSNAVLTYDCPYVQALPWVYNVMLQNSPTESNSVPVTLNGTTRSADFYIANNNGQISINYYEVPMLTTDTAGARIGYSRIAIVNSTLGCSSAASNNTLTAVADSTRDSTIPSMAQVLAEVYGTGSTPVTKQAWFIAVIVVIAVLAAAALAATACLIFRRRRGKDDYLGGSAGYGKDLLGSDRGSSNTQGYDSAGPGTGSSKASSTVSKASSVDSHLVRQFDAGNARSLLHPQDVVLEGLLGKGSFGRVYQGRWRGVEVAVKVIEHDGIDIMPEVEGAFKEAGTEDTIDSMRVHEAAVSTGISHPNIVTTYQCRTHKTTPLSKDDASSVAGSSAPGSSQQLLKPGGDSGDRVNMKQEDMYETWLVMEFCDLGTLANVKRMAHLEEPGTGRPHIWAVLLCALDVGRALEYLHAAKIIHRDLKLANVLLKRSADDARGFQCKVADFGLSKAAGSATHHSTATVGTCAYMPPELLSEGKASYAVDVYSFGIMLWELLTGQQAFTGKATPEIVFQVVYLKARPPVPDFCPPALADLMEACWDQEPAKRPTFTQVIQRLCQVAISVPRPEEDEEAPLTQPVPGATAVH